MALSQKFQALSEVANKHNFLSPVVVATGADYVDTEYIANLISMGEYYKKRQFKELEKILHHAGRALRAIHDHLHSGRPKYWMPNENFSKSIERYLGRRIEVTPNNFVFLHNDFSFSNIFTVGEDLNRICILDPCPNYSSSHEIWTYGPRMLDIGKMFACLEGQIPLRWQLLRPGPEAVTRLQRAFLGSYLRPGEHISLEILHSFSYAVASVQMFRRYGTLLGHAARALLYNRQLGNYPWSNKVRHCSTIVRMTGDDQNCQAQVE